MTTRDAQLMAVFAALIFGGSLALVWFVEPDQLARTYAMRWSAIMVGVYLVSRRVHRREERKRPG